MLSSTPMRPERCRSGRRPASNRFRTGSRFAGSVSHVRHQIGNAVPPLLAQAVAEAMYPRVMQDCLSRTVKAVRDSLVVSSALSDGDILRLKAPRRPAAGAFEDGAVV